ncbi:MAG TPA: sugar ABC transporter permease [Magnetospirillaceae bacterium]|jgi:multiple sugar transport system permease protein
MVDPKRRQALAAMVFVAPFVIAYLVLFIYPTIKLVVLSFTDGPLIGSGNWVGFKNYIRLASDHLFIQSVTQTIYFVVLTVIPNTLIGLGIALTVIRLKGWLQSVVLACFFMPFILPVTVVTQIWIWVLDKEFGVGQYVIELFAGRRVPVFHEADWSLPMVGWITIWWTNGFNVLLFVAGLRNIPQDYYDAAALDGAGRWNQFRRITWPLIWPVTALVLTIQLILQFKIFDQVYLLTGGGPFNKSYVVLLDVYQQSFQLNHGGYGAAIALFLFVMIVVFSVFQFQLLRVRQQT